MAEITESQLLELKDAFQLYSKGSNDGKVDIQELGKLFLSLGQKLSEEELKKMLADLGEYLVYSTVTLHFIVVIKRFKYFIQRWIPIRRWTSQSSCLSWQ